MQTTLPVIAYQVCILKMPPFLLGSLIDNTNPVYLFSYCSPAMSIQKPIQACLWCWFSFHAHPHENFLIWWCQQRPLLVKAGKLKWWRRLKRKHRICTDAGGCLLSLVNMSCCLMLISTKINKCQGEAAWLSWSASFGVHISRYQHVGWWAVGPDFWVREVACTRHCFLLLWCSSASSQPWESSWCGLGGSQTGL